MNSRRTYQPPQPIQQKPPRKEQYTPQEKKDLSSLQSEAAKAGSILASGGHGGLSPTLTLQVMRRDRFRCKVCGLLGTNKNGGISLHEKGGILSSPGETNIGHEHKPANIVTICAKCHDKLHTEARKEGVDSSQILPLADKGTKHDHGQPLATKKVIERKLKEAK